MRSEPNRTGRPRSVDRETILVAAYAIVKRDGLERLSVRRVAGRVGVAPNALYTYFDSKDALVDALLDHVLADVARTPRSRGWRRDVERVLHETRRALLDHPSLVPLYLVRQSVGPNAVELGERILADLHAGGHRGVKAVTALRALLVYTIGSAAFEAPRRDDAAPAQRVARARRVLEGAAADRPHIAAVAAEVARYPTDADFRAGLRWLLDGLSM